MDTSAQVKAEMCCSKGLIPEWYPQDAVLITWPHEKTDWAPILPLVEANYIALATAILRHETLVVITPLGRSIASLLPEELRYRLREIPMNTNDTWARDYAPLCVLRGGKKEVVDFRFNGWGMKFASNWDNQVSRSLRQRGFFASDVVWNNQLMLVLEGGSVDANSRGEVLTTRRCLMEENRNAFVSDELQLASLIASSLSTEALIYLDHGAIEGDDTDGHIDTLVRFVSDDTLVYVSPTDPNSVNYQELLALEAELCDHPEVQRRGYRLVGLPDVGNLPDEEGEPMPATYANFLFVNGALLVPTYGVPQDAEALAILRELLPDREVVGVDCATLIRQHGSLHCATMQFPKGFLSPEFLA